MEDLERPTHKHGCVDYVGVSIPGMTKKPRRAIGMAMTSFKIKSPSGK